MTRKCEFLVHFSGWDTDQTIALFGHYLLGAFFVLIGMLESLFHAKNVLEMVVLTNTTPMFMSRTLGMI